MLRKIKRKIRNVFFEPDHSAGFFAQAGEDAILYGIFNKKMQNGEKGFFVDIGAFHPIIHSNTFRFYLSGWRGINIDACPGSMDLFNKLRPQDINLEIGIGPIKGKSKYYLLDEKSTMNSFSKQNLDSHGMLEGVKKELLLEMTTLEDILDTYSNNFSEIDFLSVDVEGLDYEVLKSNNWNKYKPKVIVVEINCVDIEDVKEEKIYALLTSQGYILIAKNVILKNLSSVFFVLSDFEY
jgi:FkbM family methyltransferase